MAPPVSRSTVPAACSLHPSRRFANDGPARSRARGRGGRPCFAPSWVQIGQYGSVKLRGRSSEGWGGDHHRPELVSSDHMWVPGTGNELSFSQWMARSRLDRQRVEEAVLQWGSVSSLPGQHLLIPLLSVGRPKAVITSDGRLLATIRRRRWRTVLELQSAVLGNQQCRVRRGPPGRFSLVDRTTGNSLLTVTGRHFNYLAETTMRIGGGRVLSFPVRGTSRRNAVMRATDPESGETLVHFRFTKAMASGRKRLVCEAAVTPHEDVTRELIWAVHQAPKLLWLYFSLPPGGGGGGGGGG
jgi:hypothetical protein